MNVWCRWFVCGFWVVPARVVAGSWFAASAVAVQEALKFGLLYVWVGPLSVRLPFVSCSLSSVMCELVLLMVTCVCTCWGWGVAPAHPQSDVQLPHPPNYVRANFLKPIIINV